MNAGIKLICCFLVWWTLEAICRLWKRLIKELCEDGDGGGVLTDLGVVWWTSLLISMGTPSW
jgi:hypothetical protein